MPALLPAQGPGQLIVQRNSSVDSVKARPSPDFKLDEPWFSRRLADGTRPGVRSQADLRTKPGPITWAGTNASTSMTPCVPSVKWSCGDGMDKIPWKHSWCVVDTQYVLVLLVKIWEGHSSQGDHEEERRNEDVMSPTISHTLHLAHLVLTILVGLSPLNGFGSRD